MKKIFYSLTCLAATALMGGLSSCQNEDLANNVSEELETLDVVAEGSFNFDTRTSFPVTDKTVTFNWSANDKIVVLSEDGERNLGVLTLKEGGEGQSTGDFTGSLRTRTTDKNVNIYYFGRNKTNGLNALTVDENFNISDQLTAHENLTDYGIMHATAALQRDAAGKAVFQFKVSSMMTYAHFLFHLPTGVSATSETITVSGDNVNNDFLLTFADAKMTEVKKGEISITPEWNGEAGSAYMVFIPANGIAPEFSLTIGEKTYKATLPATEYESNDFICGGNPARGKDIYFSEDGAWTLTYMNGTEEFYKDEMTNFGPSAEFTVTDKVPSKTAETGAAPYVFQGWAESNGGNVVFNAGAKVSMNRPNTAKILYAVYNQDKTEQEFTLTGIHVGRELENTVKTVKGAWPTTVAVSTLAIASDDTYDFVGYYSDAACTNAVSNVTFNYDNKNITVYCKWQKKAPTIFTVIYTDGVTGVQVFPDQGTEDLNEGDKTPEFTGSTDREGYQFMGWYPTVNPVVSVKDADEDGVITYTATWKKVEKSEAGVGTPGSTGTGYGQGNN